MGYNNGDFAIKKSPHKDGQDYTDFDLFFGDYRYSYDFFCQLCAGKGGAGQFSPFFEITGNVCGFGDSSFDFWN